LIVHFSARVAILKESVNPEPEKVRSHQLTVHDIIFQPEKNLEIVG